MKNEILHIDYHIRRLILKALNQAPSKKAAAKQLGISERSIHRYIHEYRIVLDPVKDEYRSDRVFLITQMMEV